MRNLQKILALVLALVMSLSLMATAGATDFTDADQIDEIFEESVNVLDGLKVFQGYPSGDFQPKGEITRAEVAAIIYRIATGDVDDAQVGIYADYNKFSDVYASEPMSGWAAGYINYCANAEYVKGRGNGKFDPAGKVTGYEALAMILRAVGYDKNGEFTGADWAVQTAAIANQRHVTDNISAGLLGEPATREMVAEILCKSILLNTVNYTLAYGYQISTNDQDTIAYKTFKMEQVEGVVTGNEIADLESESPMAAGQTRLVIDGEKKTMNFTTGLEDIGMKVRAYLRPQSGTTVKELVSGKTFGQDDLNNFYDSFAKVSTVGNTTASEQGITSIAGAEHFINYDYVNRWTANIRITYVMDMKWTEYEAKTMLLENGGRLFDYAKRADAMDPKNPSQYEVKASEASSWSTLLTTNADYTYTYTKTIALNEMLTSQDYNNLLSIFTNADRPGSSNWITGEVYIGTASFNTQDDISDDIRWVDFTSTYLVREENRDQVKSNGLGNRLIIIDNDDDGIAEYVLQTIYTIAKVSSDVKNVDIINTKLYDSSNNDAVNSTTSSNTLVSVSGKELAKSEDALAAGDVVIYALIDGNIRAQKAETKTEKVDIVNRTAKTITVTGGEGAATYNESAVHTHSQAAGLESFVRNMAGNTNYTMYFDLDGNLAAFTEGANGGLVLITNGWYNSAITGSEYAVQAYLDGALQTVNVGASGAQFIYPTTAGDNRWGNLRQDFGVNATTYSNTRGPVNGAPDKTNNQVRTIVANLDGNQLTPVDQAYLYSQNLRVLDMVDNSIPGRSNVTASWGVPYETVGRYGNNYPAYNSMDNGDTSLNRPSDNTKYANSYEVRNLGSTVYYVVYRGIGTDTMTNGTNVVVRQYSSAPTAAMLKDADIEDVYAVGAKSVTANGNTYYTAQMVVIEVTGIDYSRVSRQVFIPYFPEVRSNVGIESVNMIDENGDNITVDVDMNNSWTYDWYNTATSGSINNSVINRTRLPGLYYMDASDTNPDVYVVRRMSPADIRNSGVYLVGYVNESAFGNSGVLADRHVQVEMKFRPEVEDVTQDTITNTNGTFIQYPWMSDFGSNTDTQRAIDTTPVNSDGTSRFYNTNIPVRTDDDYANKNVTDSTKLYIYTGSSSDAKVTENSNANVVLTQIVSDNAGEAVSGLNERWNGNTTTPYFFGADGNRNEVLVRYNGSGNIVYAVSFEDVSNRYAQQVWWNLLPLNDEDPAAPDATTISFFETPKITVSYTEAVAGQANPLVIKNDKGTSMIEKFPYGSGSIVEADRITTFTKDQAKANMAPDANGAIYRVTVVDENNVATPYILVQLPQGTSTTVDGVLSCDEDAGLLADGNLVIPDGSNLTILEYMKAFRVSSFDGISRIEWRFTLNREGANPAQVYNYTVTSDDIASNGYINSASPATGNNTLMMGVASVQAVVIAENDQRVVYRNEDYEAARPITLTGVSASEEQDSEPIAEEKVNTIDAGDVIYLTANGTGTFTVNGNEITGGEYIPTAGKTVYGPYTVVGGETIAFVNSNATELPEVDDNGVITLTKDTELAASNTYAVDTTIDLGTKTLSIAPTANSNYGLAITEGKTLTIKNGTLDITDINTAAIGVVGNSELVLENVQLKSDAIGIFANGTTSEGGVTITIKNSTITSDNVGIQTYGNNTNKATVDLEDVTVVSATDDAIYMPGTNDKLDIVGGSFTGALNGIEVRGGNLDIQGATVKCLATSVQPGTTPVGGGSNVSGAALAVSPYNGHETTVSARECAFIRSGNGAPVYIALLEGATVSNSSVSLSNCFVDESKTVELNAQKDIVTTNNIVDGCGITVKVGIGNPIVNGSVAP